MHDVRHMARMTILEVATEMRCSTETVARWIRTGRLSAVKIGRTWLVDRDALTAAMTTAPHQTTQAPANHTMSEGGKPTR